MLPLFVIVTGRSGQPAQPMLADADRVGYGERGSRWPWR